MTKWVTRAIFLSYLLQCLTLGALHLSDFEPVHLVVLFCIVTQPTHVQLPTAGCLQSTETAINHTGIREEWPQEYIVYFIMPF